MLLTTFSLYSTSKIWKKNKATISELQPLPLKVELIMIAIHPHHSSFILHTTLFKPQPIIMNVYNVLY